MRYLQAEFLEFSLNYLTKTELDHYPAHCAWQFEPARWLYMACPNTALPSTTDRTKNIPSIQQAIFSVAHTARIYYLRDLDLKTHVWGVRQLGWALRYADQALLPHRETGSSDASAWIRSSVAGWQELEYRSLTSVEAFRGAAARLSDVAEARCSQLQVTAPQDHISSSKSDIDEVPQLSALLPKVISHLGRSPHFNLRAYYLHGSAARNDTRPGSDIDSMAIVDRIDTTVLDDIRQVQMQFENLTISVYSENNINQYPAFRKYALMNGTKRVFGDVEFRLEQTRRENIDGINNNICTIRQIARSHLISASYGQRSHYMLGLMMKLLDHGCLRPIMTLATGLYPASEPRFKSISEDP